VGFVRPEPAGVDLGEAAEEVAAEEDPRLGVVEHDGAAEVAEGAGNRDHGAAGRDLQTALYAVGGEEAIAGDAVVADEAPGRLRADHRRAGRVLGEDEGRRG